MAAGARVAPAMTKDVSFPIPVRRRKPPGRCWRCWREAICAARACLTVLITWCARNGRMGPGRKITQPEPVSHACFIWHTLTTEILFRCLLSRRTGKQLPYPGRVGGSEPSYTNLALDQLVTGASGFLGWHVARILTERGHRVRALCRPSEPDSRIRRGARYRGFARFRFAYGGLSKVVTLFFMLRRTIGFGRKIRAISMLRTWLARVTCWMRRSGPASSELFTPAQLAASVCQAGRTGDEETPVSIDAMVGHYKRSKWLAEQMALEKARSRTARGDRESHCACGRSRLEAHADRQIDCEFSV